MKKFQLSITNVTYVRLILILCIYWFCLSLAGQSQSVLRGVVLDEETLLPIAGATVFSPDNQRGAISDSSGFFAIKMKSIPGLLEISHISFYSRNEYISENRFVEICLIPLTIELKEAVVYGKLYHKIRPDQASSIIDFNVSSSGIFTISHGNVLKKGDLTVLDIESSRVRANKTIRKPVALRKDYMGNVHLLTFDSIFQLHYNEDLMLLYGLPYSLTTEKLFTIVGTFGSRVIEVSEYGANQFIQVCSFDRESKEKKILYEAFDKEIFDNSRQAAGFRMWSWRGTGKGSKDPGAANRIFETYSYDKKIKYKPVKIYAKIIGNFLIILDPQEWNIVQYNLINDNVVVMGLDFRRSSQNKIDLLMDEQSESIYLFNSSWGRGILYRLNYEDLSINQVFSLDGFSNITKPVVFNNKLYFLYQEKNEMRSISLFSRSIL